MLHTVLSKKFGKGGACIIENAPHNTVIQISFSLYEFKPLPVPKIVMMVNLG